MLQSNGKYFNQVFDNVNLENHEIFENIEFEKCEFTSCNLSGSGFKNCKFLDCNFTKNNLSNLQISGSIFNGNNFYESKLLGIDFAKSSQRLGFSSNFYNCILDLCNFSQMDLKVIIIQNCSCREVYFCDTNLTKASLTGNDFDGATFHKTNFTKANLEGAKNYKINPFDNTLNQAKFNLPEAISILETLEIKLKWAE